jgi:hypothetical protein
MKSVGTTHRQDRTTTKVQISKTSLSQKKLRLILEKAASDDEIWAF